MSVINRKHEFDTDQTDIDSLYRQVVENGPSIVFITDKSGKIEYVNEKFTEITGYSKDEVLGKNPKLLKSGFMSSEFYKSMWETLVRGESWKGTFLNRKKDGSLFYEETYISPMKNEYGEIERLIAIKNDITKQIEAEQKLKEKDEMLEALNNHKDKLLSIIAHDLKNPFQSIIGLYNVLREDFDKLQKDEIKEITGYIGEAALGVYDLLENLLDWASLKEGKKILKPENINLEFIANKVINLYSHTAKTKEITLSADIKIKTVFADENSIFTILRNIVCNALKFTLRGGSVSISSILEEDKVIIKVADTGIGITPEKLNHLLENEEIDSTPGTDREPGSGFGIKIVKDLVQRNNAKLKIISVKEKGSEFSIIFDK